ncbi:MAG: 30S ribosome-binding factor RbfA [Erysipelotrichaceae bacterium]|nr:30S ribosome-binding factor RbfA [Erysipelotrichaceae bacterium]
MQAVKLERYNNGFMEELNIIFGTEVKNEVLKSVVVTSVKITNDLSFAKVYYTCFNEDKKLVSKELRESEGYLRSMLAKRIDMRHTPELNFVYDESLEYAKRIEDKIKEINS